MSTTRLVKTLFLHQYCTGLYIVLEDFRNDEIFLTEFGLRAALDVSGYATSKSTHHCRIARSKVSARSDPRSVCIVTFRVSRRRREMYTGHARLCVSLSVPCRIHALLHGLGCNLGEW